MTQSGTKSSVAALEFLEIGVKCEVGLLFSVGKQTDDGLFRADCDVQPVKFILLVRAHVDRALGSDHPLDAVLLFRDRVS